jgi:hypothetical protein
MAINYEEIIEQLDDNKVINMLNKLNIPYQDKGNYLLLPTCCHHHLNEEASWKLYYYKNTHIFHCYTECQSQSIFTFLKNFYAAQDIDYDWFTDIYEVIRGCSYFSEDIITSNSYKTVRDNYSLKKNRHELPIYSENIMDCFIKYYPIEWLNDGITKEAMDKFNIRFSPSQNKIIIPHYDVGGRLIGIRGRALNQEDIDTWGKYMPVQIEGKWYSHPLSLNLYGLNKTKENIKATGIAYLFEAEKSVLQMDSFSIPNCAAAVCGSKLNKYALDILVRTCHPQEIVVCFDQEELSKYEETYFDKLLNMCLKYQNYAQFSFIYDKENLLELKDSPTDKGEEIFLKLLKKRVRI